MTTTDQVLLQTAQNAYDTATAEGYTAQDVYDAAEKALRTARANTTRATQVLLLAYAHAAEPIIDFTIG